MNIWRTCINLLNTVISYPLLLIINTGAGYVYASAVLDLLYRLGINYTVLHKLYWITLHYYASDMNGSSYTHTEIELSVSSVSEINTE